MSKANKQLAMVCWLVVVAPIYSFAIPARADLVVAPNANAVVDGGTLTFAPFYFEAFTFQWVFDDSQFASIPLGSEITGIGFRLDASAPTDSPIMSFTQWDLQISQSLNAPGSLSGTYADNIAADVVLARSGPLTLSAGMFTSGASPNAFTTISFTTPYTYTGGDLLLTLRHSVSSPGFAVDAIQVPSALADSAGTAGSASASTVGDGCGAGGGPCLHFFNVPVTQFVFEEPSAVPEPATLALFSIGLAGLGFARRKQ